MIVLYCAIAWVRIQVVRHIIDYDNHDYDYHNCIIITDIDINITEVQVKYLVVTYHI